MEKKYEIKYILPGFLNVSRNEILIKIYENYPNITLENSCIHSFYGNFPSCIWNGGRLCLGEKYSIKQMKKIKTFHNKHGVAIALTMTNLCLEEIHLNDNYANEIVKIFQDDFNEVLVSSIVLEKYLRNKYFSFKINKSITSKDDPLKTLNNYNLSLIPSQYSKDYEYLKCIPLEFRSKIEILCNDPCINNCCYKYQHYEELNLVQINDKKIYNTRDKYYANCRNKNNFDLYNSFLIQRQQKLFVTPLNVIDINKKFDISYFKINGREKNKYAGYDNIVLYCIKLEYQLDILCFMLERFFLEFEDEVSYQIKKYGEYLPEDSFLWHERIDVHASR